MNELINKYNYDLFGHVYRTCLYVNTVIDCLFND